MCNEILCFVLFCFVFFLFVCLFLFCFFVFVFVCLFVCFLWLICTVLCLHYMCKDTKEYNVGVFNENVRVSDTKVSYLTQRLNQLIALKRSENILQKLERPTYLTIWVSVVEKIRSCLIFVLLRSVKKINWINVPWGIYQIKIDSWS